MAFSTPFRARFFRPCFAVTRFSSVQVRTSEGFGVDHTFNRANVFNHCFGDGGQVVGFQLDDKVVITKQHGGIGDVRQVLYASMNLLLCSGLNVEETVAYSQAAQDATGRSSTSPFRGRVLFGQCSG